MRHFIGTFALLLIFCATGRADSVGSAPLPPEITFDNRSVTEGLVTVPLKLDNGQELRFVIDTGCPVTVVDRSLRRYLGEKRDSYKIEAWDIKQRAGVYTAPKLYLGGVQILTWSNVVTCDLKKFLVPGIQGILGMDCLQHYAIQMDFAAGKIRFLDRDHSTPRGQAFPIVFSNLGQSEPGHYRTFIEDLPFVAGTGKNMMIDTGFNLDGALAFLAKQKGSEVQSNTVSLKKMAKNNWYLSEAVWAGNNYTNLVLSSAPQSVAGGGNVLGLRFLSRHLVTLDFPNRTLYLLPQSVGPLASRGDELMKALFPVDGKLHADIDRRLTELLKTEHLPLGVRWFGGTLTLQMRGDSISYEFSFGRKMRNGSWKLKKARSLDEKGRILEEFVVPTP